LTKHYPPTTLETAQADSVRGPQSHIQSASTLGSVGGLDIVIGNDLRSEQGSRLDKPHAHVVTNYARHLYCVVPQVGRETLMLWNTLCPRLQDGAAPNLSYWLEQARASKGECGCPQEAPIPSQCRLTSTSTNGRSSDIKEHG
jgi:hypothetical protein